MLDIIIYIIGWLFVALCVGILVGAIVAFTISYPQLAVAFGLFIIGYLCAIKVLVDKV